MLYLLAPLNVLLKELISIQLRVAVHLAISEYNVLLSFLIYKDVLASWGVSKVLLRWDELLGSELLLLRLIILSHLRHLLRSVHVLRLLHNNGPHLIRLVLISISQYHHLHLLWVLLLTFLISVVVIFLVHDGIWISLANFRAASTQN